MLKAKRLAEEIRAARLRAGMTQEALARVCGTSLNTVRKLEGGHTVDPSIFTVSAIASAVHVDICVLLGQSHN